MKRAGVLVSEGDHDQRQKSWNGIADVAPIDLRDILDH